MQDNDQTIDEQQNDESGGGGLSREPAVTGPVAKTATKKVGGKKAAKKKAGGKKASKKKAGSKKASKKKASKKKASKKVSGTRGHSGAVAHHLEAAVDEIVAGVMEDLHNGTSALVDQLDAVQEQARRQLESIEGAVRGQVAGAGTGKKKAGKKKAGKKKAGKKKAGKKKAGKKRAYKRRTSLT